MASESPPKSSLHTIEDNGAADYINDALNDSNDDLSPLLPKRPSKPRIASGSQHHNSYYVQQSYDEAISTLQHQTSNDRCGLSPVRRMFLLLSLFDFLLTFLLWIIYLQLMPDDIWVKLKKLHFDIKRTFLDIVVMSLLRSVILLSVYSCLFKAKKWYAVALTTAGSTAFLLTKVIYTKFSGDGQPMNYLLMIYSFVICWCEAWHFDFQVIPRESGLLTNSISPEQAPSLAVHPPSIRGYDRQHDRPYSRAGKSSAFFTPYAGSVYRTKSPGADTDSSFSDLSDELNEAEERDRQLIRIGNDTVHMVFRMLYINEGWTLHKEERLRDDLPENGMLQDVDVKVQRDNISVHARHFDGVGKVFKLEEKGTSQDVDIKNQALVDTPRRVLDKLFWDDLDSQPSWNASVKECQIGFRMNRKTDIVYSVTADAGGGIISSRDFVMLRRRKRKGPLTILSSVSIESDLYPPKKSIIRGKNGPGGWVLRELDGEPDKTEFIWFLNTELRGWIPQSLVEQSLASVMVDTVRDIRQHASSLPNV